MTENRIFKGGVREFKTGGSYGGGIMGKTLQDVIDSLSEEEREKFKDIIQEALERDRLIQENTEKALRALSAFSSSGSIVKSLQEVAEKLERIKENLQAIRYTLYLKTIPDSKFYRV